MLPHFKYFLVVSKYSDCFFAINEWVFNLNNRLHNSSTNGFDKVSWVINVNLTVPDQTEYCTSVILLVLNKFFSSSERLSVLQNFVQSPRWNFSVGM